jgi:hypothetical protein
MKLQVFWTGLEYTCRLLGITTAAGKTPPPECHLLFRGIATKAARRMRANQEMMATSGHFCPSVSFPRSPKTLQKSCRCRVSFRKVQRSELVPGAKGAWY